MAQNLPEGIVGACLETEYIVESKGRALQAYGRMAGGLIKERPGRCHQH